MTVLFADVVHSMDIAAAVGAERLREIMAELLDRAAAAVRRYGGTASQFTGDGIMAVFGAPTALEDHAVRACFAALQIQAAAKQLAAEVLRSDDIDLQFRIGLNSGEVVAGESAPHTPPLVIMSGWRSGWRLRRHQAVCCVRSRPPASSSEPRSLGQSKSSPSRAPKNRYRRSDSMPFSRRSS